MNLYQLINYIKNSITVNHPLTTTDPQKLDQAAQEAINIVNTNSRVLTVADDGSTLLATDYILYCNSEYESYSVNMPDVTTTTGQQFIFINVEPSYEGGININGPFYNGETTYSLNAYGQTVTFLSDGATYWVLSECTPS